MIALQCHSMRTRQILRTCLYVLAMMPAVLTTKTVEGDLFGESANEFEIEFVTIGDPRNTPDIDNNPNSYQGRPGELPVGGVNYEYRIGKYEISRGQIEKANALGNLGITLLDMRKVDLNLLSATNNEPELPATGINWYEAATFVNWLNASEGHPEAYKVRNNEFQVWEPGDEGYDPDNIFRNRRAHYFLPSVHEWYKAAFYDPEKDMYYQFATGSDTPPERVANGTDEGSAVYYRLKPAMATKAGGLSPYGTMGQSGNVWEWEESEYNHVNVDIHGKRGLRSGDWGTDEEHVSANYRNPFPPEIENQLMSFGFRVASVADVTVLGDFNDNGMLDTGDIDSLVPQSTDPRFDLTDDGVVDHKDRQFWVTRIARTWFGDADLNGHFTSDDLLVVLQKRQYEDTIEDNSGWDAGDWDGDSDFTSSDLILALQDGGFESGLRPKAVPVPDPSGVNVLVLAGLARMLRYLRARVR